MSFDAADSFDDDGSETVRTTCPYCGVGCGVLIEKIGDAVTVKGDPDHPANFGRLCSKGAALGETLGEEDRLLYPSIRGRRASWDEATGAIAAKFQQTIRDHGPDAVAFYVSGQLLTEDYYVANKLMKGFIGSANIDTNSRLCMASSVAGHKRAFGSDTVPGCYEDLEEADLVVLVGSNLAWCHPVLYQRLAAAKDARPDMKVVVVDPRETATFAIADMHLALKLGSDVALFQGLLKALDDNGARDDDFVRAHTNNADAALAAAADYDLARCAAETGLSPSELAAFFDIFAKTQETVTVYSQGVNQATDGTDRVNAIINCHLLTGRIGEPGMGPFSVTGQPNAMGGREVGGLANQLASHMELERPDHRALVQEFWNAPTMADKPGLKAVDLFEAVHDGRVKALWIMATNPVVSMPDADRVREALRRCELVVVSDVVASGDTARCADILLPSTAWGEKSGMVTNSERRMSRQRAFLSAPGDARDDWRQLCDVAKHMGWADAFDYQETDEIFREYAALCSHENNGVRDLDLGGVADIDRAAYDAFPPQQWPIAKGGKTPSKRLFADRRFFTADGRANFVVAGAREENTGNRDYPYTLNTGRIRDQWHTMTRTGRSARLSQHIAEPFVEISPADAAREGLRDAEIAEIVSERRTMLARVLVTERQRAGSLFAPMHWTNGFAREARVNAMTAPMTDPVSGQPALKSARVSIKRYAAAWYGFGVIAAPLAALTAPVDARYWVKARAGAGVRVEMAGGALQGGARSIVDGFFAQIDGGDAASEVLLYENGATGVRRFAAFKDGVLKGALYLSPAPVEVARDWACDQLGKAFEGGARAQILAARPGDAAADRGAIVCACMNVGANDIASAVKNGCASVDAIGAVTGAGVNCGSCRAEIRRFLPEPAYA